jgi:hypothetical protein
VRRGRGGESHAQQPRNAVSRNGGAGIGVSAALPGGAAWGNVPIHRQPAGISVVGAVVRVRGTVITGNRISDEHFGVMLMSADPIPGLRRNRFDTSVVEATSVH